ncbi:hypothetical protein CAC42_5546 [Sphaceloma murrayae]|uniref:Major facilitator superfamily (MFS) profile domain-containing protein n=1 Tax=Sphaceloma murrayae TaxID=2082308 RepID=A0A2K1QYF8_9PEZI|nr:hypothetical protein CAC42_5546 [Sphaceloma murrayae]
MSGILRESPFGQLARWATKAAYFQHDEDHPSFKVQGTDSRFSSTASDDDELANNARAGLQQQDRASTSMKCIALPTDLVIKGPVEQTNLSVSSTISGTPKPCGIKTVGWYGTSDPLNPQNWSSGRKAYTVFLIFLYTFVIYAASSITTSSQDLIMEKFNVSYSGASAVMSMFVAGYGLGSLLFSPLSEIPRFGRNIPYIVSFFMFVVLSVPTALSDSFAGLLVLRFLTGFAGSPCLATGGATIQDLYPLAKVPYGMTAWVAASFGAPALGPLLSAYAIPVYGWRTPLWEILFFSTPVLILWFFTMPETSADNILLRRAQRLRKISGDQRYKAQCEIDGADRNLRTVVYEALAVPFLVTVLDPTVLFVNIYTSIIYSTYYSFFEVFPLTYLDIYKFSSTQLSLVYTCTIIPGASLGIIIYVTYQYFHFEPRLVRHGPGNQESRLLPATLAAWLLPIGLFLFGWTASTSIHWIASILGIVTFACGAFVLFQCIFMYLPLTYPRYAASLFAMNDAFRSVLAAGSVIYSRKMYEALGVGRGVSVLGGLMVLGSVGVVWLFFWGERLRRMSRFAG